MKFPNIFNKKTLLHFAVMKGKIEIIQALLKCKGIDINLKDNIFNIILIRFINDFLNDFFTYLLKNAN